MIQQKITVLAYAKVNLALDILYRRPDGYHELDSVMQMISLHDTLTIAPDDTSKITLQCDIKALESGDNLVCRAARIYLDKICRGGDGLHIILEKRIPHGAGLGGGSSDAAATLLALQQIYEHPLSDEQLLQLAATLGADVPFFLLGATARMEGIGERLTPIFPMQKGAFLLAKPTEGLSTPAVYGAWDTQTTHAHADIEKMCRAIEIQNPASIAVALGNSLESVGISLCPKIAQIKQQILSAGALGAMMTGSGSAVFGIWEEERAAQSAHKQLQQSGIWSSVAVPVSNLEIIV